MRRVLIGCLWLAACGEPDPAPLVFDWTSFKEGPRFHLPGSAPGPRSFYQYAFTVKSNLRQTVKLAARLEGTPPKGMEVRVAGTTELLRQSTSKGRLIIVAPSMVGPFESEVTLFSSDLPDWKISFPVTGDVVDKPLEGRYIRPRPHSRDLGQMKPGETKPFAIALGNGGTERITIRNWSVSHEDHVKVRVESKDLLIVPGAELQISGHATAPKAAGPFTYTILVESDAQNHPRGTALKLFGVVAPDYTAMPLRHKETAVPATRKEFEVTLRAREGKEPFVVDRIDGLAGYLTVVDKGSPEPAAVQKVRFQLLPDAPTDVRSYQEIRVRFRLAPVDVEVDWPVKLRLYPKIYPMPERLNFGWIGDGSRIRQHYFDLRTLTGEVGFKVKSVRSLKGKVVPRWTQKEGITPRVYVDLPPELGPGQHQDTVVVETDDPDVPSIHVPVWVGVRE